MGASYWLKSLPCNRKISSPRPILTKITGRHPVTCVTFGWNISAPPCLRVRLCSACLRTWRSTGPAQVASPHPAATKRLAAPSLAAPPLKVEGMGISHGPFALFKIFAFFASNPFHKAAAPDTVGHLQQRHRFLRFIGVNFVNLVQPA